jgi:putative SbcD/Mre11-related phosphoesterase
VYEQDPGQVQHEEFMPAFDERSIIGNAADFSTKQSSEDGFHTFGEWRLTPEGAAIQLEEQTAVVADLHLGYEWARGAAGDCVIAHSLDETLTRLARVLVRARVTRLIVAGDLVESPRPCVRTRADVRRLRAWLGERGVSLLALEGNHDRGLSRSPQLIGPSELTMPATFEVAQWTIGHGHQSIAGKRTISGHHHPVLRADRTTARCFLVGPRQIVLPAFSSNAAGCDVATAAVPKSWLAARLRCLASTGTELLDFGTLTDLRKRMRVPPAKRRR